MSTSVGDLLTISAVIAIGFLLAVAFYESLSTRDVLVARTMRLARRSSRRPWVLGLTYAVTVGIGIPLLVVLWTVVLEVALFVVGSVDRLSSTALVAVSVVGAARILAYIREKTSHELAKAIPLAFAFLLLTGGSPHLDEKLVALADRADGIALTDSMIVFLIGLEIGLRLLADGSNALLAAIRRRRGIESQLGVWRTLRAALRRPLAAAPALGGDADAMTPPASPDAVGTVDP
jgi:hypothetical protein